MTYTQPLFVAQPWLSPHSASIFVGKVLTSSIHSELTVPRATKAEIHEICLLDIAKTLWVFEGKNIKHYAMQLFFLWKCTAIPNQRKSPYITLQAFECTEGCFLSLLYKWFCILFWLVNYYLQRRKIMQRGSLGQCPSLIHLLEIIYP